MQIEQALYGEASGGHSLLDASVRDQVPREIIQRLDLPDTAPPGVEWSPFLRGFPYRDRYVLARTFLDTRAPRGGMVFSHALIVRLDEITQTLDLKPILRILTTDERSRPDAQTVHLSSGTTEAPDADDLLDAAEALASARVFPVVRVGYVGFDDLVVALWGSLLPEMRRHFAFRLSFGPHDLVERYTPTLVCTPHPTVGRWNGYRILGTGASHEPTSLASAMLGGRGNPAPLLDFVREIGGQPSTFTELQLFNQAYELTTQEATLKRCIAAVRLVANVSPDPNVGCRRKEVLVKELQESVCGATADQILLMRNLRLSALPSPDRVWQALKTWMGDNAFVRDEDRDLLSALKDATSDGPVAEWRAALLDGLAAAARACSSNFQHAFWRWIQVCHRVVDAALHHVIAEGDVEKCVAETTPHKLSADTLETLLALARSSGWLRVHGALLSLKYEPVESARQQVAVDNDLSFMDGIRLSLRYATPEQVLNCALEIGDPRTILLAGREVAKRSELFAQVDFKRPAVQAVWHEALVADYDAWQGPTSPEAAFHTVLDSLLDGGNVNLPLIDQLALTPVADLCDYPRRTEIWRHVDGQPLQHLLAATAKGWLTRASNGHVPFQPEAHLQYSILETDELEPMLRGLSPRKLRVALGIVSALDHYCESRFKCLMDDIMAGAPSLSGPAAKQLGRLVLDRQWRAIVDSMVDLYKLGRRDLKPALRVLRDMLDFWTRWLLGLARPSTAKKWEALEELVVELYPGGPSDQAVWQRAGGNDADLVLNDSGRMQWREALRDAKRGKGVGPWEILRVMKKEFPGNQRVSLLSRDPVFHKKGHGRTTI